MGKFCGLSIMLVAEGKENDQGPGTGGRATESEILYTYAVDHIPLFSLSVYL